MRRRSVRLLVYTFRILIAHALRYATLLHGAKSRIAELHGGGGRRCEAAPHAMRQCQKLICRECDSRFRVFVSSHKSCCRIVIDGMAQQSPQKLYHVGIICALATEKAAMEAMLDEEHPPLDRVFGDDNDYTLGRIEGHNVAVACLPAGSRGQSPAATVARDMLRTFPIKIGLMVGIGGGAPSAENDIRLGDVVVSASRDGNGGVFQYDFGKTIQNQIPRSIYFRGGKRAGIMMRKGEKGRKQKTFFDKRNLVLTHNNTFILRLTRLKLLLD